jgi:hypothetical protein
MDSVLVAAAQAGQATHHFFYTDHLHRNTSLTSDPACDGTGVCSRDYLHVIPSFRSRALPARTERFITQLHLSASEDASVPASGVKRSADGGLTGLRTTACRC